MLKLRIRSLNSEHLSGCENYTPIARYMADNNGQQLAKSEELNRKNNSEYDPVRNAWRAVSQVLRCKERARHCHDNNYVDPAMQSKKRKSAEEQFFSCTG